MNVVIMFLFVGILTMLFLFLGVLTTSRAMEIYLTRECTYDVVASVTGFSSVAVALILSAFFVTKDPAGIPVSMFCGNCLMGMVYSIVL